MKKRIDPAELCWLGVGLYILAADAALIHKKQDTMSICFGHWVETPRGKILCATGTGAVIAHLFLRTPLPLQSKFRYAIMQHETNKKYRRLRKIK